MDCRNGCGACCIAPSINSAIPGMPEGKPANVRCINLDDHNLCVLWGSPDRPEFCEKFQAEESICGQNSVQALDNIRVLEQLT